MDVVGAIVYWVVVAAIAVAIALAVLWLIFRVVTEVRPRDRRDR